MSVRDIFKNGFSLDEWVHLGDKTHCEYEGVSIPELKKRVYTKRVSGEDISVGVFSYNDKTVFIAWGFPHEKHCRFHATYVSGVVGDVRPGCPDVRPYLVAGKVCGFVLDDRDVCAMQEIKHQYTVTGMHCTSCAKKVEATIRTHPAVVAAVVHEQGQYVQMRVLGTLFFSELSALFAGSTYTVLPLKKKYFFASLKESAPLIGALLLVSVFSFAGVMSPSGLDWHTYMTQWMGIFFLLFGGLKVLNLRGFAQMYRRYDIVAKRFSWWGYVYPGVEVCLGVLFMAQMWIMPASFVTAVLMGINTVGVYQKLQQKDQVPCACLGGFFTVPVTWVTFGENVLMCLMALIMLGM